MEVSTVSTFFTNGMAWSLQWRSCAGGVGDKTLSKIELYGCCFSVASRGVASALRGFDRRMSAGTGEIPINDLKTKRFGVNG